MTEYELMYLYGEAADRFWNHIQFWTSVSFGYLVLGHVAAKKLNWFLIIALSALYVAFSVQMFQITMFQSQYIISYLETITTLYEAGTLKTPAAIKAATSRMGTTPIEIASIGTFMSALLYLPYNHWRSRRDDT